MFATFYHHAYLAGFFVHAVTASYPDDIVSGENVHFDVVNFDGDVVGVFSWVEVDSLGTAIVSGSDLNSRARFDGSPGQVRSASDGDGELGSVVFTDSGEEAVDEFEVDDSKSGVELGVDVI